jgi:hypothetical protein
VTVPSAARPESRVRCPLCAEEYSLEGIFAELPPLLVLLDAPAPNGASGIHAEEEVIVAASASSVGGSSSIFDYGERESTGAATAGRVESSVAVADVMEDEPQHEGFSFGGPAAAAGEEVSLPRATTVRPKAKKKASPIKSLIGVVGGGLLALPLAQLVLWYLPGGWGVDQRDPVGIGRNYPKSLGILAPSWVKNPEAETVAEETREPTETPVQPRNEPPQTADNSNPNNGTGGNDDTDETATDDDPPPDDEGSDDETVVDDGGNETPPDEDPPPDEPAAPPSPVKNAPTYTNTELGDELKAAKAAEGKIEDAVAPAGDGREKRAAAESFLLAMSKLAHVLTFSPERQSGHLEHVGELMSAASETSQRRVIVSTLAVLELGKQERETNGTLFMGVVRDIQQRGELYETVVETATQSKKPLSVYTAD